MKHANTIRMAALAAGTAVAIGGLAPAAVAAPTATGTATTATSTTTTVARPTIRRDGAWERAVYAQLNATRKRAGMRPVTVNACITRALVPIATRSAQARRAVTMTKADRAGMDRCFGRAGGSIQSVWGPARGSAASWIVVARRYSPAAFTKNRTTGGVVVMRGTNGVPYVALAQFAAR